MRAAGSHRGMDQEAAHQFAGESIIGPKVRNFLSNEDAGKQACFELAPGFFIFCAGVLRMDMLIPPNALYFLCQELPRVSRVYRYNPKN
jgi:hypothetical protein